MSHPLNGITIIELGQIIAGTYGGQVLSDLGAEVIKVETPSGDLGRIPSVAPINGESGLFLTFNRNKKSIVIDLKTEEGLELFYELVKKADVVIDNFRPGVLDRLKINYEILSKINKKLIQCSVTGYGESGEYANLPALDIIIQSITGYMAITGEPDRPPVRTGIPLADLSGGIFSSQAIMAALYKREKTGKGSSINLSMFDGMLSLLTYLGTVWLTKGELPIPPGSSHMYSVPWQAFKVKDGYVVIATRQEVFWERMCDAMNIQDIKVDDTFELIASCIDQVYSEEESWTQADCTKKELKDFLEQLDSKQFKMVEKFFETMPKLSHTVKVINPNTKKECEIKLEGLQNFFV